MTMTTSSALLLLLIINNIIFAYLDWIEFVY